MDILETLRAVAPEFNDTPDDDINKQIDIYKGLLSAKRFGRNYNLAVAYLVAHEMTLVNTVANAGADSGAVTAGSITSEREGDLERTYGDNGGDDSMYSKTIYGRKLLDLLKLFAVPVTIRIGCV